MVVFFFQFYNKLWQKKAKQLDLSVEWSCIVSGASGVVLTERKSGLYIYPD